ncbi:MAG: clan AA aspartic protease [Deltaproteobacteria bacterium]|nr:clan AA aspartic protease [Deltaproteobacteria bacterium]
MTRIKLTNGFDEERARLGEIPAERVRTVELEALVDTGATMLMLPADVVSALGLAERSGRRVRYADGRVREVPLVGGVSIEILGRSMLGEALVEAAGTTPLIGQIPLEALDLVVDPKSREVTVNPASPDAPLLDLLAVA